VQTIITNYWDKSIKSIFLPVLKGMKCPQTKLYAGTMSDSNVIRSKTSQTYH